MDSFENWFYGEFALLDDKLYILYTPMQNDAENGSFPIDRAHQNFL